MSKAKEIQLVVAFWVDTLESGQLYLQPPWQIPVWTLAHTNSVFTHSRKRPAPVAETFSASRGCPLTGASTVQFITLPWPDIRNFSSIHNRHISKSKAQGKLWAYLFVRSWTRVKCQSNILLPFKNLTSLFKTFSSIQFNNLFGKKFEHAYVKLKLWKLGDITWYCPVLPASSNRMQEKIFHSGHWPYSRTYMTKNNTLSYGHHSIHVGEGLELVFFVPTHHVKLFYVVQALLFPAQPNDDWIWYNVFCKLHHLFVIRRWEQQHLTIFG